jgi:hypothetical protein
MMLSGFSLFYTIHIKYVKTSSRKLDFFRNYFTFRHLKSGQKQNRGRKKPSPETDGETATILTTYDTNRE